MLAFLDDSTIETNTSSYLGVSHLLDVNTFFFFSVPGTLFFNVVVVASSITDSITGTFPNALDLMISISRCCFCSASAMSDFFCFSSFSCCVASSMADVTFFQIFSVTDSSLHDFMSSSKMSMDTPLQSTGPVLSAHNSCNWRYAFMRAFAVDVVINAKGMFPFGSLKQISFEANCSIASPLDPCLAT